MLRNNADARRCSYFELALPVVCTNGNHDSETKFASPEFCLPFAQTIDRPVCHVHSKQPKCPLCRKTYRCRKYLGIDRYGWTFLINSEIIFTSGQTWPFRCD